MSQHLRTTKEAIHFASGSYESDASSRRRGLVFAFCSLATTATARRLTSPHFSAGCMPCKSRALWVLAIILQARRRGTLLCVTFWHEHEAGDADRSSGPGLLHLRAAGQDSHPPPVGGDAQLDTPGTCRLFSAWLWQDRINNMCLNVSKVDL